MNKGKNWVDYKELKSKITLEMVLTHYDILSDLKQSGQNLVSCCPIHKGSNSRQFSVSLEKNIWNCFGNCKTGGNVIDFVSMMEFGNKEPDSIRKAALLMKDWFLSDAPDEDPPESPSPNEVQPAEQPKQKKRVRKEKNESAPPNNDDTEPINPPLTFQLKSLDPDHPFFEERGISPKTVRHFNLGLCSKGIMKGHIAIPIYDHEKNLVAYCGRAVSPDQVETEGKYKLPPRFIKSAVVYNLHRQPKNTDCLILVESFLSVFVLHQAGYPNTVALMGSVLSEHQEDLITRLLGPDGNAILMFDADDDGKKCTRSCLGRLCQKLYVKAIDLEPYARKPHQLSEDQISSLIG
jgi:DNA primase